MIDWGMIGGVVGLIALVATLWIAWRGSPRLSIVLERGVHPGFIGPDAPMPAVAFSVRNRGKTTRLYRFWLRWGDSPNELTFPPIGGQHALPGGGVFLGSGRSMPIYLAASEIADWTRGNEPVEFGIESDEGDLVTTTIPDDLRAYIRSYPGPS